MARCFATVRSSVLSTVPKLASNRIEALLRGPDVPPADLPAWRSAAFLRTDCSGSQPPHASFGRARISRRAYLDRYMPGFRVAQCWVGVLALRAVQAQLGTVSGVRSTSRQASSISSVGATRSQNHVRDRRFQYCARLKELCGRACSSNCGRSWAGCLGR